MLTQAGQIMIAGMNASSSLAPNCGKVTLDEDSCYDFVTSAVIKEDLRLRQILD